MSKNPKRTLRINFDPGNHFVKQRSCFKEPICPSARKFITQKYRTVQKILYNIEYLFYNSAGA